MAGYRPADWHPLDLDRDPTPGDPQRVRSLATQLHDFADDVSDALRLVKGMAGEDTLLQWAGKSADVFKEQFKDVPKNLKKLKKSYEMCGDALADYWPKLERAQALADKALAKAKEAQSDLSSAKSRLSSADSWVTRAGKEADKYKDDPTGSKSDGDKPDEAKVRAATRDVQSAKSAHTKAQSDVTTAQNALDAAKKMAEDARKMRDDAAGEAKRKIDEASDAGIPNRHWWQDVGHWFEDNWDTIVTVCKVVVAVVGIIALIIGGPILGAIVLVAALVVLADTLYKYSKGQASLWDVAFAALDCIPGGKGITSLGKLAKGLKEMKNLRGGMKAMSLALRGLGKNARGMLADGAEGAFNRLKSVVRSKGSDPVDMATGAMYLPQSDIELPGLLPLTFTRRVASDYRCGWWFGPSWASTLDERLEVDEQGVVHVTEDGLLLAYPHPTAPQTPAMPEAGPRRPLTRQDDGGYRIEDPLTGHTRHFARPTPDGTALLTRISDRNQHAITFDHDEHGTPLAIRHSGGYHLRITIDEGRVTALSLAGAADDGTDVVVKRYGYTDGNLTETVNSSGLPLRFTYDDRLRVTSWTDTNNSRYAYTYDDHDRCIAEGGEAGHIAIALDYDGTDPAWPGTRVTTLTTAQGAVTRFVVNDNSQVIAEIDPLGNTTRTEYDERHHEIAVTDPLGHSTRYVRDGFGRPLVITYPDGATARFAYDRLGRQTEAVQADGSTWRRTYDERGNCTTVTGPTGVTVGYSYDDSGRLTSVIDALGNVTRLETNAAGLTTALVDPRGNHERRRYDAFGRVRAVGDSAGGEARLSWTVEGRIAHWTGPDGTAESWEYDGEGNCVRHTDPCGGVTSYEYTHFDLLSATTGPDGARYTYDHDASLRLTRVTNPRGLTWTYTYDPAGRVVSERDFDGRVLRYEYDASGRVTARENALGERIAYERDMLGQVAVKTAGGVVTRYEHDAMGRLLSAGTDESSVRLERDDWGRIVAESVGGRAITFAYDPLGRRTRRTTPSGLVTEYVYDAHGRRSSLSTADHTLRFGYDVAGREITREVNTALTVRSGWDPSGLLAEQVADTARGTVQHRCYSRRPDGQVVGVEELTGGRRRIELDAVGRVTSVSAQDWAESYAYDTAGDQTEADWPDTHPGEEARGPRGYEGTRVTRAGRVRYEYDAAGRLVTRRRARLSGQTETWRYTWDVEDRLTSVVTPDGTLWRYRYDVFGRRIAKQRAAADGNGARVVEETRFTWDGDTLVEQTTTGEALAHAATVTWDHDGLHPVAQTERLTDTVTQREIDSRFFAIITDLVGTPTELVDERGDIAWRTRSTLFGATAWPKPSTAYTPLRFPGQYHDSETGLHYNRHRYYAPETGHYISPDPLGLTAAPHPTAYVPNPWTGTDPLGLSPYEPFYRVMSEKEFSRLGPKGEITPRGENFVTQEEDYVRGIAERFGRRGGRNAQKYTHLVRYEMEPGTREALIAAGRGSGDNIAAIKEAFGLHLDEIGESTQFVHVKMERGGLNFGLREGSAGVFNSNILRMTYERI
ncbi:RHS repeat-associated core domain-containing protein [Streptomyces sp. NPDC048254]|uniref:RHS repeat-associated core domain-containing protein n=1 Tax=Streptomyces sp. NPDC048254 TaxID=3365525 RepID=UPI003723FEC6